jgi:hypothetical protein
MLFLAEIVLAIRYFVRINGPRRFQVVVGVLVTNAVAQLISTTANAWQFLIIYRVTPPTEYLWPIPMMIICKVIAATTEQFFLIYRYYGLSKSMFWTTFVVLTIIAHFTAGIIVGVALFVHPAFTNQLAILANTVTYCLGAAMDILIPILLIWELRKIKPTYSSTQSLIRRIVVNAASSGCIVAIAEIFALVLFLKLFPAVLFGCAIVGPFYGITVLVNLFVCQRSADYPTTTRTKSYNLTTLDSVALQTSVIPPHPPNHSSQGQGQEVNDKQSTSEPFH